MPRFWRAAVGMAALVIASPVGAQDTVLPQRDPLARLYPPSVRMAVEIIIDSARNSGLPVAPLESKVLEGLSKRQDHRKILFAVRNVYRALADARTILGPTANADELSAAGSAIRVGISTSELSNLAKSRRGKQITVPLVVLVDLVTRGVPRDTASQTIFQLWQGGAGDDDFYGLWRSVERDIVSGTDPGVALLNRAREVPTRAPPVSPPESEGRQQ